MANSTTTMITSIAMIILFTIAIIGYAIGFANDNDAEIRIDQNPDISSMNVFARANLSAYESKTEKTYASIANTTIETGSDVIKSPRVFTITWSNLFDTLNNIMTVMYSSIFGRGGTFAIFLTTFGAMILLLFAFYIIKAWRGNP